MNKNKNQGEDSPQNAYKFYLGSRQRYIHITSQFQSGNIQLIRQLSEFNYRLNCVDDGVATKNRVNSKSWFYFQVSGFTRNTKGRFTVSRVQTLIGVYHSSPKSYRPVFRQKLSPQSQWSPFQRVPTQTPLILRQTGQLQVQIDFPFKNEQHHVQFAFTYPYPYSTSINYLNTLNEFYSHDQFYYHRQILTQSPQKRLVHLLTITSHDQPSNQPEEEEIFDQRLFPERCRPKRFKKPVILITARVHPGQTAASYAMEGVIDFLVNTNDARSYLLKKMFVFMIVPMINVDGVYHGHFRMDGFGKNLNRYYIDPKFQRQPAVFAIRSLADHLIKSNRLSFYFDLHAHNAKKGHFIYGNAINDFVQQVQSQVFCKLFALNHKDFQYQYCNFSKKQMNSKDRNEERTKQGCGRVVMHKIANIIHSYSLECGIISSIKQNSVPQPMNNQFQLGLKGLDEHKKKDENSQFFTQQSYRDLGKSMLVSILDVFDKNPFNRVYNSPHKSMELLRRMTAFQVFHTAQRFRMFQKYVYGKVRNINQLIRQVLNSKLHYRQLYNFYFYNDKQLKNTQWPQNIPGLVKPKFTKKLKRFKSLQEPRLQYSLSFLEDLRVNRRQLQHPQKQPYQSEEPICPQDLGIIDDNISSQTENEEQQQQRQKIKEMMMDQSDFYKQMMMQQGLQVHSQVFIPFEKQSMPFIPSLSEQQMQISRWNSHNFNITPKEYLKEPWQNSKELSISQKDIFEQEVQEEDQEEEEEDKRERGKSSQLDHVQINFKNQPQNCTLNNLSESAHNKKLKIFQRPEQQFQYQNIKIPPNESPSMRVRRLMKNQSPKRQQTKSIINSPNLNNFNTNPTPQNFRGKFNEMVTPQAVQNSFAASNTLTNYSGLSAKTQKQRERQRQKQRIDKGQLHFHDKQLRLFEQIKLEIREELRRHKEKEPTSTYSVKPHPKSIKYAVSQSKQKPRIKSTNINFVNLNLNVANHPKNRSQFMARSPSKSSIVKTQLPALNSHILIITSNSSKGLVQN